MLNVLQSEPGRTSEKALRRVAARQGFEIFDDQRSGFKRISLGRKTVLIDVDVQTESSEFRVDQVLVTVASPLQPSNDAYCFTSPDVRPSVHETILQSLREPRLDAFSRILALFARLDSLSSDSVDCFRSLDEISIALFTVAQAQTATHKEEPVWRLGYGEPVLNPKGDCEVGLMYWKDCLAMLDVAPIEKSSLDEPSALRYSQDWLKDAFSNEWNDPTDQISSKARLILRLNPPAILGERIIKRFRVKVPTPAIQPKENHHWRKPLWVQEETVDIDSTIIDLLPYDCIEVSEIPVPHPKQIPLILASLRSHRLIWQLIHSLQGSCPQDSVTTFELNQTELSLADVLADEDYNKETDNHSLKITINLTELEGELALVLRVNTRVLSICADSSPTPVLFKLSQIDGPPISDDRINKLAKVLDNCMDLRFLSLLIDRDSG